MITTNKRNKERWLRLLFIYGLTRWNSEYYTNSSIFVKNYFGSLKKAEKIFQNFQPDLFGYSQLCKFLDGVNKNE